MRFNEVKLYEVSINGIPEDVENLNQVCKKYNLTSHAVTKALTKHRVFETEGIQVKVKGYYKPTYVCYHKTEGTMYEGTLDEIMDKGDFSYEYVAKWTKKNSKWMVEELPIENWKFIHK